MGEISHTGRIISITPDVTSVRIERTSACAGCHARQLCGMGESEEKVIEVPTDAFAMHSEGDEVQVCLKRSMGMKAVWISYVIPLVILLVVLGVVSFAGAGELVSGLSAIGAVALYYSVILLLRKRLENEFVFYIK